MQLLFPSNRSLATCSRSFASVTHHGQSRTSQSYITGQWAYQSGRAWCHVTWRMITCQGGLILALHCAAYLTMCCKIPFVCFKPPLYNLISCNLLCNLLCLLKLFAVSLLTTNCFVVCWGSFNFYLPGILIILVFCKEVVGWSTVYKSYRVFTIQYN